MGKLLEFIVKLSSVVHSHIPQKWKRLDAAVQDALKGGSRHLSTSIVPALEYLSVELLYLAKAYENVLWGYRTRKRIGNHSCG